MKLRKTMRVLYSMGIGGMIALVWFSGTMAQNIKEFPFILTHPFFDLDYATFKAKPEHKVNLELYLQISNQELQFTKQDNRFEAQVEMNVYIFDEQKNLVEQKFHRKNIFTDDYDGTTAKDNSSLFQFDFDLPPANYRFLVQVTDKNSDQTNKREMDVNIADFNAHKLQLSSVELSEEIMATHDENSKADGFLKNNRRVIPKPTREYSAYEDVLGIYFEVYNLAKTGARQNSILAQYQIKNLNGEVVLEKAFRLTKPVSETAAISLNCPIDKLTTGKYKISVSILDEDSKSRAQKETDFFRWSSRMDEKFGNIGLNIDYLQFIASPAELNELKNTPKDKLAEKLVSFWKSKDPTPGTEENELMADFYARIAIVNRSFGVNGTPGWQTDQGKIFIRFGMPDFIYKQPYTQSIADYVIWEYREKNIRLVFVDRHGFGDYELLRPATLSLMRNY